MASVAYLWAPVNFLTSALLTMPRLLKLGVFATLWCSGLPVVLAVPLICL